MSGPRTCAFTNEMKGRRQRRGSAEQGWRSNFGAGQCAGPPRPHSASVSHPVAAWRVRSARRVPTVGFARLSRTGAQAAPSGHHAPCLFQCNGELILLMGQLVRNLDVDARRYSTRPRVAHKLDPYTATGSCRAASIGTQVSALDAAVGDREDVGDVSRTEDRYGQTVNETGSESRQPTTPPPPAAVPNSPTLLPCRLRSASQSRLSP